VHARLSASKAGIFMKCSGAPSLWDKAPDTTSSYAEEGTNQHSINEVLGRTGKFPRLAMEISEEAKRCAEHYVSTVNSFASHPASTIKWETQVSLAPLGLEDMWGTCDTEIYSPQYLHIMDYKHGAGVYVNVDEEGAPNSQLMYYLLGAVLSRVPSGIRVRDYLKSELEEMYISIVQPRTSELWPLSISEDAVRTRRVTAEELIAFAEELKAAVQRVQDQPHSYTMGSHCRFCKAKDICPAQMQAVTEYAKSAFDSITSGDARKSLETLTPEQLADVLDKATKAEDFIAALRKYVTALINTGVTVPGYGLVPTRPTRKWVDEQKAWAYAMSQGIALEDIMEKKMISPAKFEKLIRDKAIMQDLTVSVSSGTKLNRVASVNFGSANSLGEI
jgi:hypothetical protein